MKIIEIKPANRGHQKLDVIAKFTVGEMKVLKRLVNNGNKILRFKSHLKPDGKEVRIKGAWISLKKVFGKLKLNYPNQ